MEDFELWDSFNDYETLEPIETVQYEPIEHETTREKIKGFDELVRGLKNKVNLKTLSYIIRHKYEGVKKIMYDVSLDCKLKGISIEINNNEIYFKLNQDVIIE